MTCEGAPPAAGGLDAAHAPGAGDGVNAHGASPPTAAATAPTTQAGQDRVRTGTMAHTETTGGASEPDGMSARAPADGARHAVPPGPAALPRTAAEARRLVSDLLTTQDGRPPDGSMSAERPYGAGGPGSGEHPRGAGDLRRGYVREDAGLHGESAERARTDALLAVSELVTNAIRHGGGLTGFTARLTPDGLLLHVEDAEERLPVARDPLAGPGIAVGGYGWPLVCRIAREVTVDPLPGGGKRIAVLLPRS